MIKIAPAILVDNLSDYQKQLALFSQFAVRIQVDVTDGQFTKNQTVSLSELPQFPSEPHIDLHLMAINPSRYLAKIIELKPSLCILHAESGENLIPLFEELRRYDIKPGLALYRTTFPEKARSFIEKADHVLIFAGELGVQGSTANLLQLEKIKLVKNINKDIEIGWDGGVNLHNIRALAAAGVDIANVGSAITRAKDPAAAYHALIEESDKRGVVL